MQSFEKLDVWQFSHDVNIQSYSLSKNFPPEERYGVTSQFRRAASSVPTNIAEGCGRFTSKDQAHFFQIAFASAQELHYLLIMIRDLEFGDRRLIQELLAKNIRVKKMLSSLLKVVRNRD